MYWCPDSSLVHWDSLLKQPVTKKPEMLLVGDTSNLNEDEIKAQKEKVILSIKRAGRVFENLHQDVPQPNDIYMACRQYQKIFTDVADFSLYFSLLELCILTPTDIDIKNRFIELFADRQGSSMISKLVFMEPEEFITEYTKAGGSETIAEILKRIHTVKNVDRWQVELHSAGADISATEYDKESIDSILVHPIDEGDWILTLCAVCKLHKSSVTPNQLTEIAQKIEPEEKDILYYFVTSDIKNVISEIGTEIDNAIIAAHIIDLIYTVIHSNSFLAAPRSLAIRRMVESISTEPVLNSLSNMYLNSIDIQPIAQRPPKPTSFHAKKEIIDAINDKNYALAKQCLADDFELLNPSERFEVSKAATDVFDELQPLESCIIVGMLESMKKAFAQIAVEQVIPRYK